MCVSLHCVFLCVSLALGAAAAYDSQESRESFEVFVSPYQANAFMRDPRGAVYNRYIYRRMKSPAERRAELCEDLPPCRLHALRFGSQAAYQTYFSPQQLNHNPQPRRY